MLIDIVIPTRDRLLKLYNCVGSILNSDWGDNQISIKVAFNDEEELTKFKQYTMSQEIMMEVFEGYRVPTFWNTYLLKSKADVLVCLNDDTILKKHTILKLEEAFKTHFPDYDCVIGLNQSNGPVEQCLDSAFCAIGIKYSDRFPNRQVYCPDYFRFYGDKELGEYAKSINKFYFAKEVEIIHLHPAFTGIPGDETHNKVREFLNKDRVTYTKRQQLNYLWGSDYNLLSKE